ncbi:MAG: hypothetical protein KKA81_14855 [Bacteroidetes bacterium]|nr:hypothetical protein [Bacteroidota bacterium]
MRRFWVILFLITGVVTWSMSQEVSKAPQPVVSYSKATTVTPEQPVYGGEKFPGGSRTEFDPATGKPVSLYLNPVWQCGEVVLGNGEKMVDCLLRYNIYAQQMQFIRGGDTLAFADPAELDYLIFDGREFRYLPFLEKGVMQKGYFEVLADGPCRLLLRRVIVHHVKDGDDTSEDKYFLEYEYYLEKEGETAKWVPLKKKEILHRLEDHSDAIKAYIRDNGMHLNTCEDFKKVVEYYNSLN